MKRNNKEQRADIFDSLILTLKRIEEKLRQGEEVLNFSYLVNIYLEKQSVRYPKLVNLTAYSLSLK